MRTPTLRVIRPASREAEDLLSTRLLALQQAGFRIMYDAVPAGSAWTYSAGTAIDRARSLADALLEAESDVVLCARGGYGASDLLTLLPWAALKRATPKLLVGFSDISALHSALYAQLGWPGLHGPMPATTLWQSDADDVGALRRNIEQWVETGATSGSLPIRGIGKASSQAAESYTGALFGGCFAVLTNLLGTPYFPASLGGHIVFLEDTDEHPARLMRYFNQWLQTGALQGVKALIIGHLRRLGPEIADCAAFVLEEFAVRAGLPVFHTPLFGHTSPNVPLAVGAHASISAGRFSWHLSRDFNASSIT